MSGTESVVAADVGNSAVKVAITSTVTDELNYHSFLIDQPGWTEQICDWVRQKVGNRKLHWMVSTVNRGASDSLALAVGDQFTATTWQLVGHLDVPIEINVDHPDRVGVDRIIGAYAASNRHPTPLIIVDVGSAVTVDLVGRDADGKAVFQGGAILPGIRLQHAALETGTANLRRPDVLSQLSSVGAMEPGKNTERAIRLGVIASVSGAIERLAEAYRSGDTIHPESLVLTGGDGPLISAHLKSTHDFIPQLVCLGLLDLRNSTIPHHG